MIVCYAHYPDKVSAYELRFISKRGFCPFFILGGGFQNVAEYGKSAWKRILANTEISIGTKLDSQDSASSFIGTGLRCVFFDSRDPLLNKKYAEAIGEALVPEKRPTRPTSTNEEGGVVTSDKVKKAHDEIIAEMSRKSGWALSLALGYLGRIDNSEFVLDSIHTRRYSAWCAGEFYLNSAFTARAMGQMRTDREFKEKEFRFGAACQGDIAAGNLTAEALYAYNSEAEKSYFLWSVYTGVKLFSTVRLIYSTGTYFNVEAPRQRPKIQSKIVFSYNFAGS